jgi:hypothetical protein
MKIGYVRVSKQEQNEALQIDARDAKRVVKSGLLTRLLVQKRSEKDWPKPWRICGQGIYSWCGRWIGQDAR